MAVLIRDFAKSAVASINYVLGQKGHNGKEIRNEYVSYGNMNIGMDPRFQMKRIWDQADVRVKRHMMILIQSFSSKELDPSDPDKVMLGHQIGVQLAEAVAGDRQYIVGTQTDGVEGLVHNHILINTISPSTLKSFDSKIETDEVDSDGKRRTTSEYELGHLRRLSDEIVEKNGITLDHGDSHGRKYTHAEAALSKKGRYVWKDDLRGRIDAAVAVSDSFDDFISRADSFGITVHASDTRKNITYELKDTKAYEVYLKDREKSRLIKEGRSEDEAASDVDAMDFTPKRKPRSRDSALGGRYSKEGIEDTIRKRKEAEAAKADQEEMQREGQQAALIQEKLFAQEKADWEAEIQRQVEAAALAEMQAVKDGSPDDDFSAAVAERDTERVIVAAADYEAAEERKHPAAKNPRKKGKSARQIMEEYYRGGPYNKSKDIDGIADYSGVILPAIGDEPNPERDEREAALARKEDMERRERNKKLEKEQSFSYAKSGEDSHVLPRERIYGDKNKTGGSTRIRGTGSKGKTTADTRIRGTSKGSKEKGRGRGGKQAGEYVREHDWDEKEK